jgi:hypothetical protein
VFCRSKSGIALGERQRDVLPEEDGRDRIPTASTHPTSEHHLDPLYKNMVHGPAASVSLGNLLENQEPRPHPRPTES